MDLASPDLGNERGDYRAVGSVLGDKTTFSCMMGGYSRDFFPGRGNGNGIFLVCGNGMSGEWDVGCWGR